jgi:putative copper resistance protein D
VNQLDRWPPLFGTPFGHWLLVKIACLLLALACAAVLRWHWLPRRRDPTRLSTMQRWLSIEALAALIVAGCASALALTPPGRHAAIDWPFPFRLAWTVAWQQPSAREATWTGIGILAAAAVLGALAFRCGHRSLSALLGVVACGATAWVALPPLSVDAQPVTYRVSTVAYDAASIASGRRLFVAHCAGCHGHDADGRGPAAGGLARPPADLTAPHAGDHTPGDLYGWVSDGIRGGVMPAFAGQLQEDERWDVVNYLHTLAGAYQARVIQPRVAQGNPWLGAPGFAYETVDGQRGSLRDWRGSTAVLLILDTGPASAARLQRVAAALPALRAEGVTVLRMPLRDSAGEPSTLAGIVTLRTDPDVAFTYQQYRHTLERLRASESGPLPGHLEFLIDRFGYLRARWITEDTQPGWDDLPQLLEQLRGLRAEPRLKPSPDDHLH